MAEILSNQYQSVFSTPKTDFSDLNLQTCNIPALCNIEVTEEAVRNAIKNIKPTSAPGPDGIPAFLYKEYTDALIRPLIQIFNMPLKLGKLPEGVALAIITPIYKSGDKSLPVNYRPVGLPNHLTKILERILSKEIIQHLEFNNLMNPTQHGFRIGRSTISQLLTYYNDILNRLEEGNKVDSIYLDFSKAFDRVDHGVLIKKIESLNITGKILAWLEVFLTNRKQAVKVENHISQPVHVTSGVPQGSVLGPLLFIILMLDIDQTIFNAAMGSFADDTRVWTSINTIHCVTDLQSDLNSVYSWAKSNNMKFNEAKFDTMSFGINDFHVSYTTPSGKPIEAKKLYQGSWCHHR